MIKIDSENSESKINDNNPTNQIILDNKEKVKENNNIDIDIDKIFDNETYERFNIKECCQICCAAICLIFCSLLAIFIELVYNFAIAIIFIYYKNHCKECKSELYKKIDTILYIYLAIIIIIIILIIFTLLSTLTNKENIKFNWFLLISIFILISIVPILKLTNIIIVQKYYNKTKSWEGCGNFKNWSIVWLVFAYFGFIINILKKCFKKKEEKED